MAVSEDIRALVNYACDNQLIGDEDRVWAYNAVLEAVGATGPEPGDEWVLDPDYDVAPVGPVEIEVDPDAEEDDEVEIELDELVVPEPFDLEGTLGRLADVAVENGVAEDTASGRDRAAMRVMGVLTPRPSDVVSVFDDILCAEGPRAATDWFYKLCCDASYVRRAAIARNIAWTTPGRWGELEITINRS